MRIFVQQHSLTTGDRIAGFTSAGLWDRVSHLPFILSPTLFSAFMCGQLDASGTGTVQLRLFADAALLPVCTPSPFLRGCGELVRVLKNLQLSLGMLLSDNFDHFFDPLLDALEGREQPLLYLPSDFLLFMISNTIYEAFRIHWTIPGSETMRATYISEQIALLLISLLDKDSRTGDMDRHTYLGYRSAVESGSATYTSAPPASSPFVTAYSATASSASPLSTTPTVARSLACQAHAKWASGASGEHCRFGDTCRFTHGSAGVPSAHDGPTRLQFVLRCCRWWCGGDLHQLHNSKSHFMISGHLALSTVLKIKPNCISLVSKFPFTLEKCYPHPGRL